MFNFENKPIQDWTLAECKQYCENRRSKINSEYSYCRDYCTLHKCRMCGFIPEEMNLKTIPQFTPDEIAFCRLIKKTYPYVNYVSRNKFNDLKFTELTPQFNENGTVKIGTTGCFATFQSDFLPQIKPLTYYAIDDIIKQGENDERK